MGRLDNLKKRVLLAEDSRSWQKFHESLLRMYDKAEIELIVADNAKDAMQIINKNLSEPFDLVITDLQMELDFHPDMAGEWFLKQLLDIKEYNVVPKLIVSAAYNVDFIAANFGVKSLSKRVIANNQLAYNLMLDEIFLSN